MVVEVMWREAVSDSWGSVERLMAEVVVSDDWPTSTLPQPSLTPDFKDGCSISQQNEVVDHDQTLRKATLNFLPNKNA